MSITIDKAVRYRAMCDQCRALSRWWPSADRAAEELNYHLCERVA